MSPRTPVAPFGVQGFFMSVDRRRQQRAGSAPASRLHTAPENDPSLDDDALILAVAIGDKDAFELLYLRLAPGVFGLALCIAADRHLAEDVTRDVFDALWVQAPSFDPSRGTIRAWAMTLTHHLALDAAQRAAAPDLMAASAAQGGTMAELQRQAIALAYFGGLTPTEVARVLDLPASTVTTQIRDGLRELGRTG